MWSPSTSTLIHGERDAILVDPLIATVASRALADWVVATGKNVTAVFVTHAHGGHFLGASPVLDRFPNTRLVATPGVVAHMAAQWGPRWFDGFWNPRFPDQISDQHPTAQTPHRRPARPGRGATPPGRAGPSP
jgi:glyoxylase-like metal-dependent hydrolase (beta-lactamase superfamily II)